MSELLEEIGLLGSSRRRGRETEKVITGIQDIDAETLEPCEIESKDELDALGDDTREYTPSECIICKHDDGSSLNQQDEQYQSFEKTHQKEMYRRIKEGFFAGKIIPTCNGVKNYFNDEVIERDDQLNAQHGLEDINLDIYGIDTKRKIRPFAPITAKLVYCHYWKHDQSPELEDIKMYRQVVLIINQKISKGGIYKRKKGTGPDSTYFLDEKEDKSMREWIKLKSELKKKIENPNNKKK
jgi:hypothetical protein